MTVSASAVVRSRFNCTGGTIYNLPVAFKFFDDVDLVVYRIDSLGNESVLDLVTDYSVSGGDGGSGAVTTVTTFSDGELLVLLDLEIEQGYDMIQGDGFLPDELEDQLDRQTLLIKRLDDKIVRTISFPETTDGDFDGTFPAPVADQGIKYAADAKSFESFPLSSGDVLMTSTPTPGAGPLWEGLTVLGYAALQAIPTGALTDGWTVNLAYRTTIGDGGGGQFYWDSSDLSTKVAADEVNTGEGDGGRFVTPTSDKTGASGAWVRRYDGPVQVAWYGDIQVTLASMTSGGVVEAPGSYAVDTLDISNDNTTLDFVGTGVLTYSGAATSKNLIVATLTGDNCSFINGTVTAPAGVGDGTNEAWVGAVVLVTGENSRVENNTLNNVPKVGVGLRDVAAAKILNNKIHGNFDESGFTGAQTALYGVNVDPAPTIATDKLAIFITGNEIDTSVQGVFVGNVGATSTGQGIVINNNILSDCWNHGVYNAGFTPGVVVDGNSFLRCQTPVAMTGEAHVISDNTMQTNTTGNGHDLTGISLRDPVGCTIIGNTMNGDAATNGTVIDLRGVTIDTLRDNIISKNIIKTGTGTSNAIVVGTNGGTACKSVNNAITDNIITGAGKDSVGLIFINGISTSDRGQFNVISGNMLTLTGNSHGIGTSFIDYSTIENNKIIYLTNPGSSFTLAAVQLSNASYNEVNNNSAIVPAGYGTNIALRVIWELGTSISNNTRKNTAINNGSLTSLTQTVILATSGTIIDESGTGAPNTNAGVGSKWTRLDGGTSTTLYVKESGITTTGWVGK